MIHHHPDQNLLLEYASGSLPLGPSLVIAAHVQLCAECRRQYHALNSLGGSILRQSPAQPLQAGAFERVMARIERAPDGIPGNCETPPPSPPDAALADVPPVLGRLLAQNPPLRWEKVTRSLQICRLRTGQKHYEVAFHRLCSGGEMAEHDHRGNELALVLNGSFSDQFGVYKRGDFILRQPGQVHKPIATQDQACVCLSAVSAPVAVTGISGWLLNPLIPFRPG
ncbi:ChrR family anti-sigma-E factor [Microbulbifer spongiae]|uniref:ChrR family anti-sigma-E factor n=1 Tax=Microbulbifer spongiae TaxID=2944933 RepID=A0ABY9E6F0_9GAMM|nr:ChrR family anti-sigma-E factor [Microbulbifer sp. MI-G]WKD48600.1 ChrR family anti-sigma-E factor [Microbulbifer sp. MI-G]